MKFGLLVHIPTIPVKELFGLMILRAHFKNVNSESGLFIHL
jgi:hypothetical protein